MDIQPSPLKHLSQKKVKNSDCTSVTTKKIELPTHNRCFLHKIAQKSESV